VRTLGREWSLLDEGEKGRWPGITAYYGGILSIIAFHERFLLEGHRRSTFMMIDRNVIAASLST
jgi:hypothetical protein